MLATAMPEGFGCHMQATHHMQPIVEQQHAAHGSHTDECMKVVVTLCIYLKVLTPVVCDRPAVARLSKQHRRPQEVWRLHCDAQLDVRATTSIQTIITEA
jgi:hypothetical protein